MTKDEIEWPIHSVILHSNFVIRLWRRPTPPGFEPGQREPKSLVLPLHYGVKALPKGTSTTRVIVVGKRPRFTARETRRARVSVRLPFRSTKIGPLSKCPANPGQRDAC